MAQLYEIVVFTDSMGGLADEVRERERESDVLQNAFSKCGGVVFYGDGEKRAPR